MLCHVEIFICFSSRPSFLSKFAHRSSNVARSPIVLHPSNTFLFCSNAVDAQFWDASASARALRVREESLAKRDRCKDD
ncbi:hypothetical protein DYB37_011812 [Aphanomyces astaci]|uniref:Uncharacterized protein n=1 Tax=Aphanomyces astaci TaxID=112090 RepID=A0A418ET92_APHAT|nr:hypothetical protein DYB35_013051 [Aphanomyces astaci]RHZ18602.1 hypothetical protein DYB37_011812 [Aphanomyces astaci]